MSKHAMKKAIKAILARPVWQRSTRLGFAMPDVRAMSKKDMKDFIKAES